MSKKCTPLWREAHFQVKMYKNTSASDDFWKLRCRKSARPCGAKHISKSKCTKHTIVGPLLEVETPGFRTTFGGSEFGRRKSACHCGAKFRSQNVQNTRGSDHFWRFRCRFASLHYTTLHYTTLHYTTLQNITLHHTPVHYITLHYTTLQYTPLH